MLRPQLMRVKRPAHAGPLDPKGRPVAPRKLLEQARLASERRPPHPQERAQLALQRRQAAARSMTTMLESRTCRRPAALGLLVRADEPRPRASAVQEAEPLQAQAAAAVARRACQALQARAAQVDALARVVRADLDSPVAQAFQEARVAPVSQAAPGVRAFQVARAAPASQAARDCLGSQAQAVPRVQLVAAGAVVATGARSTI